jgi:hypothetical protein
VTQIGSRSVGEKIAWLERKDRTFESGDAPNAAQFWRLIFIAERSGLPSRLSVTVPCRDKGPTTFMAICHLRSLAAAMQTTVPGVYAAGDLIGAQWRCVRRA